MSRSLKSILSASAVYTIGDFLSAGVSGLVLLPVYLHAMGQEEYGIFGVVSTLIMLGGVILQMGCLSAFSRYFFHYRETGEENAFLGSLWIFQIAVAGLVAVIGVLAAPLFWNWIAPGLPLHPYLWLVLAGSVLSFPAGLYSMWLRNNNKAVPFVVLQVAALGLTLVASVVLVTHLQLGAMGAVAAVTLSTIMQALVTFVCLRRTAIWGFQWRLVRGPLVFGLWMAGGTLCYVLLSRAQLLVLQQYTDLATVGVFNLALQFSSILVLMSNSFGKAWQPAVYESANVQEACETIAKTSRWFLAVMLFAALAMSFFSGDLLRLLARHEYFKADAVIRLTLIASFIYSMSQLPAAALLYQKRAGLSQLLIVAAVALNIALLVVCVPRWQALGAAAAMLSAFAVYTLASYVAAQLLMPVKYDWSAVGKIVLCGVTLWGLEAYFLQGKIGPGTTLLRVILVCCFPLALLGLGVFNNAEKQFALARIREGHRRFCAYFRQSEN